MYREKTPEGSVIVEAGFRVGYARDPGRCRPANEDCLYVNEHAGLFIVADGMGGHNAGEVASTLATAVVAQLVQEGLVRASSPEKLLRSAINEANGMILSKTLKKTAWSEMETTVLVALLRERNWYIAHVGDSRAYMITDGVIEQITQDHTFVVEWLKEGLITEQEARTHAQRHGLAETLGVTDDAEIDIDIRSWNGKGCLLLCSDGLTDMIEDREIKAIVESSSSPHQACRQLVEAANNQGGEDNITVILICPSAT